MSSENLRIILITLDLSKTITSLVDSSLNIVGLVESKHKSLKSRTLELKNYSNSKGLPYYYMDQGCNEKLENWIRQLEPNLIVVNGMSELLKKNILEIPDRGCINLHPTLLPRYRGGYPVFWTFYDFNVQSGVTVHYLDEGEDTGDIIYQESVQLPLGSTHEDFLRILEEEVGTRLLIMAITDIENKIAPRIKQPKESPTVRARQIKPCEYKKIINWEEWGIERVWHLLRGTQNWLDVFDFSEIKNDVTKWRILHFVKQDVPSTAKLGVVYKEENNYFIYCKQGKIFVELTLNVPLTEEKKILSKVDS